MTTPAALALEHRQRLLALQSDLRDSLYQIGDGDDASVQLSAVIETVAEALGGLAEAFDDFAEGDEKAWKG